MKVEEEFYTQFWKSADWSCPLPNHDEQVRWSAIRTLLNHVEPNPMMHILDFGCGRGWLTNLLSQYHPTIGVDPVAGGIRIAKSLFPLSKFAVGGVSEALVANAGRPFDVIVCSEVIEHVANSEKFSFLCELRSALRPSGHLILTTPRGEWLEQARAKGLLNQPIEDWATERQLAQLLADAGFHVRRAVRRYVPSYNFSLRLKVLSRQPFLALRHLPPLSQAVSRLRDGHGIYQAVLARNLHR